MKWTDFQYGAILAFAFFLTLPHGSLGAETPPDPQFPQGDLAINGSCEAVAEDGKTPLGWALMGDAERGEVRIEEKIAHSGTRSVYIRTIDSDTAGRPFPWKQAAIYGNSDGLDGSRAFPVVPEARYVITFFSRGRDDVKPGEQSQLEVYLLIWTTDDGTPASRKVLPRSYSKKPIPLSDEWVEHEVDFAPALRDKTVKRMALVFVPTFPSPPDETPATIDTVQDAFDSNPEVNVGTFFKAAEAVVYIDDISITACDGWGVARHLTIDTVREGCEIPTEPKWQDTSAQPPLTLWSIPGETPIDLSNAALQRPRYNPLPEGWDERDLGGAWKIQKLDYSTITMKDTEDPGTTEGFFKPEFDDSRWPQRTVPSIWEGVDKLYPDGMVGFGSYRQDFQGIGWLRTRFTVPETFKGRRLMLRFDGVDTEGTIFLNGVKLGKTVSPGVRSDFDATDAVKADGENLLAVRLYDANNIFFYDTYQWGRAGGPFKPIKLIARPALYARRTLITPRLAEDRIEVETWIDNPDSQPTKVTLEAEVAPDPGQAELAKGNAAVFTAPAGEWTLPPGGTNLVFSVPMPKATRWSPDNPYLYILQVRAGKDVLAKERFGMREFKRDGRYFWLNGERIYLPGIVLPSMNGLKAVVTDNRENSYRKLLAAYQGMGFRMFLSHSGIFNSDLLYEFCDEMGLMLYEWRGTIWPDRDWLDNLYNHPSVCMFALGNETRHVEHRDILNRAYEAIKRVDKQNRPVCSITGGAPKVVAPKTDFVDMHIYPGDINNHYLDMSLFMYGYNSDTWVYHRDNMPVVSYEMGGNRATVTADALPAIRQCMTTLPLDKKKLVRMIVTSVPGYEMPAEARWLALYGIRRYAVDDWDKVFARGFNPAVSRHIEQYRQRYVVKGLLEDSRRLGDLFQGYGININLDSTFGTQTAVDDPKRATSFNLGQLVNGAELVTTDAYQDYLRCNQLHFVCADVVDKNVFAPGTFAFRIYAINDKPQDSAPWSLRVVIKDKTGKCLCDRTSAIGTVPAFKRRIVPFSWAVPADLPRDLYDVELFLLENGQPVSDNFEHFFVMPREELAATIKTGEKKVALYDIGAKAAALDGGSTTQVLDDLKVPYTPVTDFDTLDHYQVLMIGARSLDDTVATAGKTIDAWIRAGGRLIQFEQIKPRALPYLPQLSVVRRDGGVVADLLEVGHPAFEGIRLCDNWDRWSGEMADGWLGKRGGIYIALIGPLNQTVQASGILATPRDTCDAVAMLISEVRLDKGLALLSQAEATRRYGKDSVATRYLQNAIRHILSDETAYAFPLEGLHFTPVNRQQCGYIDLSGATEKFDKIDPVWIQETVEGLKECGNLPFRWNGKSAVVVDRMGAFLTGNIKIEMATASKILDTEGERQMALKNKDQGRLIPTCPESLYFLHTAERDKTADTGLPLEEIGAYIITYTDRKVERIDIDTKNTINFRDLKKDSAGNAKHAGQGFYVTRWINPYPEKPIKTIEVEIKSDTTRLILLGITSTLVREKIHH